MSTRLERFHISKETSISIFIPVIPVIHSKKERDFWVKLVKLVKLQRFSRSAPRPLSSQQQTTCQRSLWKPLSGNWTLAVDIAVHSAPFVVVQVTNQLYNSFGCKICELHKVCLLFTGRPDVLLFHLRHQVWRVNPHDRRDYFRSCMDHGSYLVATEKQMGWQHGSTKGMKFWVSSYHVALMHYDILWCIVTHWVVVVALTGMLC